MLERHQMAGARDGKEFGQPLDNAEKGRLARIDL
jgi:hypothetical protein